MQQKARTYKNGLRIKELTKRSHSTKSHVKQCMYIRVCICIYMLIYVVSFYGIYIYLPYLYGCVHTVCALKMLLSKHLALHLGGLVSNFIQSADGRVAAN